MEFIHFEVELDQKAECYADDEESDMDDNCSSEDDFFIDDRPLPEDSTPPRNPYLFPQRPSVWQSKFVQFLSSRSSKTDHLNKKQKQKQKRKRIQKRSQKKEQKQVKKIRDKKTKRSSSKNPKADSCYDTEHSFNSHRAIDLRQGCDPYHAIVITDD